MRQIALPIDSAAVPSFENFVVGDNAAVVHELQNLDNAAVHIFGPSQSGKTHLLRAAAASLPAALYVDLAGSSKVQQNSLLAALDGCETLLLDHCDEWLGSQDFERLWFDWVNDCRAHKRRLISSSRLPVAELPFVLPDLRTRIEWGLVMQLLPLPEDALLTWLQQRAVAYELEMPDAVGRFLLANGSRDTADLTRLLLEASNAAKGAARRLTIPFVKSYMP